MGNYISFYGTTEETESQTIETATVTRKYGWKRDKHDVRDLYHNFYLFTFLANRNVDLREQCPEVYDQGNLGSCTANAIAGAYEFDQIKQGESKDKIFTPSRLFIYYNEREMEGSVEEDAGAELRDGVKSINKIGVCPEPMWKYDISKFTDKPSEDCYETAKDHSAVKYRRVKHDLDHLRQCICEGFPFVFGFEVFKGFESKEVAETGKMQMPKKDEDVMGGHAVMAVGFNDHERYFIVRNSWGSKWGDNGYFYMPYDFIKNKEYCSDFWTVTKVQDQMN